MPVNKCKSTMVVSEVQKSDRLITFSSVLWLSFALPLPYSLTTLFFLRAIGKKPRTCRACILIEKILIDNCGYLQRKHEKGNTCKCSHPNLCKRRCLVLCAARWPNFAYHFQALSSLQALAIHDRWPHAVAESYLLAEKVKKRRTKIASWAPGLSLPASASYQISENEHGHSCSVLSSNFPGSVA